MNPLRRYRVCATSLVPVGVVVYVDASDEASAIAQAEAKFREAPQNHILEDSHEYGKATDWQLLGASPVNSGFPLHVDREPTEGEAAGMNWYNSLTIPQRHHVLAEADRVLGRSGRTELDASAPADAWRLYQEGLIGTDAGDS